MFSVIVIFLNISVALVLRCDFFFWLAVVDFDGQNAIRKQKKNRKFFRTSFFCKLMYVQCPSQPTRNGLYKHSTHMKQQKKIWLCNDLSQR